MLTSIISHTNIKVLSQTDTIAERNFTDRRMNNVFLRPEILKKVKEDVDAGLLGSNAVWSSR
jgi:hypothetical protein